MHMFTNLFMADIKARVENRIYVYFDFIFVTKVAVVHFFQIKRYFLTTG